MRSCSTDHGRKGQDSIKGRSGMCRRDFTCRADPRSESRSDGRAPVPALQVSFDQLHQQQTFLFPQTLTPRMNYMCSSSSMPKGVICTCCPCRREPRRDHRRRTAVVLDLSPCRPYLNTMSKLDAAWIAEVNYTGSVFRAILCKWLDCGPPSQMRACVSGPQNGIEATTV